jgi:hypothetical protein
VRIIWQPRLHHSEKDEVAVYELAE